MKIKSYFVQGVLMLSAMSMLCTACSDDDPIVPNENVPQEEIKPEKPADPEKPENKPDTPKDWMDKVHEIYDNASIEPQEVTTVNQLAILTSLCAAEDHEEGPISVTNASLNNEPITLITLGGTEEVEGQATTMKESQLASFGKPNDYLAAVRKLFEDGVVSPKKPIIITGISLGGMIAQQMISQEDILSSFKLHAIITFGSPITLPLDRKGIKVVRFEDVNDKVPRAGELLLRTGMVTGGMSKEKLQQTLDELDKTEKIARTSKYTGMLETHALSYVEDACWSDTDFLGDPEKKNVLVLKETMRFYPAPKRSVEE